MSLKHLSLMSLLILTACSKAPVPIKDADRAVQPVTVQALVAEPWAYVLNTYGELRSAETVDLSAEAAGSVSLVNVRQGTEVDVGDVLLLLDSEKQRYRLTRAEANRDSIAADLSQAARQLEKFSRLRRSGAVSADQFDKATANHAALTARLTQAESEISIAERELQERTIRSPLAGIIKDEPVETGERVQAGQVLLTVQSNRALEVVTWVNQQEVNQLPVGAEASVLVSAGSESHAAAVATVARSASSRTGNFEVKLRLENLDERLREGMSATVKIAVQNRRDVIFIPRHAVVDRERRQVVFVLVNGVAQQRAPVFGLPERDRIPVLSGLEHGETLIVEPLDFVTDGVRVRVGSRL